MPSNKPFGLSKPTTAAPVIETEGDVFASLRRIHLKYKFAAARFENLLRGRRAVLENAEKDERPALHEQVKRLERTHKYYETAARNVLGMFLPVGHTAF